MLNDYVTYSGYQIGVSHVSKGLSCEDYSANYIDENMAIAVISDGHGDINCFRSAKGAELACSVALDKVKEMFVDNDNALEVIRDSPDRVITELEKSIIHNWNIRVIEDVRSNPFTEAEYSALNDNVILTLKSGQKQQKVYGCTLIMCVLLKEFWFGIQIGDGKCVVCAKNGLYSQPIPQDNVGCIGNRSTSICNSNAFECFRYFYSTELPAAVFVASDGVDESFDENGLNKCYYSVAAWIKTLSKENYERNLEQLLGKISKGGSGDDVSIACIISKKDEIKKPYATSAQVAEKMEELFSVLKDAEKRYIELTEKKREVNEGKEKLELEIADLQKLLDDKKQVLDDKKCEKESINKNIDNISKQLQQLSEQFANAKETKKKVDEYWEQLGVDICDNSEIMKYIPIDTHKRIIDACNALDAKENSVIISDMILEERRDGEPKKGGLLGNFFKK